jgi:hypothetical protein
LPDSSGDQRCCGLGLAENGWLVRTAHGPVFGGFTVFQFRFYAIFLRHKLSEQQATDLLAGLANASFQLDC